MPVINTLAGQQAAAARQSLAQRRADKQKAAQQVAPPVTAPTALQRPGGGPQMMLPGGLQPGQAFLPQRAMQDAEQQFLQQRAMQDVERQFLQQRAMQNAEQQFLQRPGMVFGGVSQVQPPVGSQLPPVSGLMGMGPTNPNLAQLPTQGMGGQLLDSSQLSPGLMDVLQRANPQMQPMTQQQMLAQLPMQATMPYMQEALPAVQPYNPAVKPPAMTPLQQQAALPQYDNNLAMVRPQSPQGIQGGIGALPQAPQTTYQVPQQTQYTVPGPQSAPSAFGQQQATSAAPQTTSAGMFRGLGQQPASQPASAGGFGQSAPQQPNYTASGGGGGMGGF